MNILKLTPVILSFALLCAHFFRAGQLPFVILLGTLPVLLYVKQWWVARLLQVFLVVGSVEWIRTLFTIAVRRHTFGLPWGRLVIILGLVTLFTALSSLVFQSHSMKKRYKLGKATTSKDKT